MAKYKTLIFKDLDEFDEFNRHVRFTRDFNEENADCNGVTKDFLKKHGVTLTKYEKMNTSNRSCWNCWECDNCDSCLECESCLDCSACTNCSYCDSCYACTECKYLKNGDGDEGVNKNMY